MAIDIHAFEDTLLKKKHVYGILHVFAHNLQV